MSSERTGWFVAVFLGAAATAACGKVETITPDTRDDGSADVRIDVPSPPLPDAEGIEAGVDGGGRDAGLDTTTGADVARAKDGGSGPIDARVDPTIPDGGPPSDASADTSTTPPDGPSIPDGTPVTDVTSDGGAKCVLGQSRVGLCTL